jgi:hypothetical protein
MTESEGLATGQCSRCHWQIGCLMKAMSALGFLAVISPLLYFFILHSIENKRVPEPAPFVENKRVPEPAPFVLDITLKKASFSSTQQVLYGSIVLFNNSRNALEISSNGCWLQFVDFHFFDESGTYLGKSNYGNNYYLYPTKLVQETIFPREHSDSSIAARPPSHLAPGTYFVEASFDYGNTNLRSNRLQFTV